MLFKPGYFYVNQKTKLHRPSSNTLKINKTTNRVLLCGLNGTASNRCMCDFWGGAIRNGINGPLDGTKTCRRLLHPFGGDSVALGFCCLSGTEVCRHSYPSRQSSTFFYPLISYSTHYASKHWVRDLHQNYSGGVFQRSDKHRSTIREKITLESMQPFRTAASQLFKVLLQLPVQQNYAG